MQRLKSEGWDRLNTVPPDFFFSSSASQNKENPYWSLFLWFVMLCTLVQYLEILGGKKTWNFLKTHEHFEVFPKVCKTRKPCRDEKQAGDVLFVFSLICDSLHLSVRSGRSFLKKKTQIFLPTDKQLTQQPDQHHRVVSHRPLMVIGRVKVCNFVTC